MEPDPLPVSTGARRVIAGALLVGAVVVVGVGWLLGDESEPPVAAADLPAVFAPVSVDPPAVAAGSLADAGARADAPGEVQMCGGAWVKLKEDGEVDRESVEAATRESDNALSELTLAAMTSSADEQARGAALAMRAHPVVAERVKLAACKGDATCERDLSASALDSIARRDALARFAKDSSDPLVYGWAVRACGTAAQDAAAHCQVINAAQWARLEPSNAAPWIAVAARAQAERDPSMLEDALFRVAAAERYDPGDFRLASVLLDHVPAGEANLHGASALAWGAVGIAAAQATGDSQILLGLCPAGGLSDPLRRDACDRVAAMLVKGSAIHLGLVVGRAIGKRAGWPEERLQELQKEAQAIESKRVGRTDAESVSCGYLQARLDDLREFAERGQVAVLRKRLAQAAPNTLASASSRGPGVGALPR